LFEFELLKKIIGSSDHKILYISNNPNPHHTYTKYFNDIDTSNNSSGGKRKYRKHKKSRKPNTSRKHWKG
jgi:hypothetical protein